MRLILPTSFPIDSLVHNPRSVRLSRMPPPWRTMQPTMVVQGAFSTITPSGTTLTKTAWVQTLSAAQVTSDITLLALSCSNANPALADASAVLDIGTGAAGSESVVVADIPIGSHISNCGLLIPVRVPSGTRVAMRASFVRTATAANIYVAQAFLHEAFARQVPATLDVLGNNPASATGTAMSGASGTWVQITASTTKDYQCLWPVHSLTTGTNLGESVTYSIGVGASGSEVVVGQYGTQCNSVQKTCNQFIGSGIGPVSGPIPVGSRIAVRHNIVSTPGNHSFALIGVPYV